MTKVDRSMGDIHPQGNPHYWLPPANARLLAKDIAGRLVQLDPEGKPEYDKNLAAFLKKVSAKEQEWAPALAKIKGTKVATYHKSWSYVSQWLGLEEIGYVEPKPGIPPDPSHLVKLIGAMRTEKAKFLLVEDFYNKSTAQLVADKSGAKMLTLATDVGASEKIKSWFDVTGALVTALSQ